MKDVTETEVIEDLVHRLDEVQHEIHDLQAEFRTRERMLVKALIEMKAVDCLKPVYPMVKRKIAHKDRATRIHSDEVIL